MKRFWKKSRAVAASKGWAIELDGRPLKTPSKDSLVVPSENLATAIATEWNDAGEEVDPRAMPLTGIANAALDRVVPAPDAFAGGLAKYCESDLLCYRVDIPDELAARQARLWDPLLAWARRRYDVDFAVTTGVGHVHQPDATVVRLKHAVAALDPFRLAGLSPLVTIGGSLVAAMAVVEGTVSADDSWHAVSLDERWQLETWGSDAEAEAAMAARYRDFTAAANFLTLLDV